MIEIQKILAESFLIPGTTWQYSEVPEGYTEFALIPIDNEIQVWPRIREIQHLVLLVRALPDGGFALLHTPDGQSIQSQKYTLQGITEELEARFRKTKYYNPLLDN